MASCANDQCTSDNRQADGRYRLVLCVALVLNGSMFLTEIVAGLAAGSAALQADAVDFLSDAANYGISLSALACRSSGGRAQHSSKASAWACSACG